MLLKRVPSNYLCLTTGQSGRWTSTSAVDTGDDGKEGTKKVFKAILEDGPKLGDFIAGVVPRGQTWTEYDGKLKREKGDNERYD